MSPEERIAAASLAGRASGAVMAAILGLATVVAFLDLGSRPRRGRRLFLGASPPGASTGRKLRCIRLKSAARAQRELGLTALPKHVRRFGEWMLRFSGRELTPRDVVKAYVLTRSSIQRSAIRGASLRRTWPDHPWRDDELVRPEHAMARLLRSPEGQHYLDAAERGELDSKAARAISSRFAPFGLGDIPEHKTALGLQQDLERAATQLAPTAADVIDAVRSLPPAEWSHLVETKFHGISWSKAGFLSALLGRGDLPTVDARAEDFWRLDAGTKVSQRFVQRLSRRLAELDLRTPTSLRPFYQHLAHHAVWDALGRSKTTHDDLTECMDLAGPPRRDRGQLPLQLAPPRSRPATDLHPDPSRATADEVIAALCRNTGRGRPSRGYEVMTPTRYSMLTELVEAGCPPEVAVAAEQRINASGWLGRHPRDVTDADVAELLRRAPWGKGKGGGSGLGASRTALHYEEEAAALVQREGWTNAEEAYWHFADDRSHGDEDAAAAASLELDTAGVDVEQAASLRGRALVRYVSRVLRRADQAARFR